MKLVLVFITAVLAEMSLANISKNIADAKINLQPKIQSSLHIKSVSIDDDQ